MSNTFPYKTAPAGRFCSAPKLAHFGPPIFSKTNAVLWSGSQGYDLSFEIGPTALN